MHIPTRHYNEIIIEMKQKENYKKDKLSINQTPKLQSKKMNTPWNGKYKGEPLPVGVYVYMIDLKAGGGILKGTVTLLR